MAVHWRLWASGTAPLLSDRRLIDVQERLGVAFPADYVDVVRSHQGATPDRTLVTLPDGTGTNFSILLYLEDGPAGLNLLDILDWSEQFPDGVIPFAIDPFGNYLCFDYGCTTIDPLVVFLPHDEALPQPQLVAGSFTELIDSLQHH